MVRRIGFGSYGEIWLAINSMGVYRAVKIVYRDSFSDQKPFERELSGIRKFEPISRTHEGFIDILQVGFDDAAGCFFYIMELGDDGEAKTVFDPEAYRPKTLASEIAAHGRIRIDDCLQLGSDLAKALHQLHTHGLVHRDIKPSNIVFVEGKPKLADIGMVAGVDDKKSYVGTEGFIPPEGAGAPGADIYSLGKVLYEASTGEDRQHFPELPAALLSSPESQSFLELNEIILRACKNDVSERYKTAAEMNADLVVLLDGKSVKRLRQLERSLLTAKRVLLGVFTAAVVGLIVFYPFYQNRKERNALRQRDIGSAVAYGNHALETGDLLGSLPFYAESLRLQHEAKAPEAEDRFRLGTVLAQCPKLTRFWTEETEISDVGFSPDDSRLILAEAMKGVKIFNLTDDSAPVSIKLHSFAMSVEFSPDGQNVVIASGNAARIFDAKKLNQLAQFDHPDQVTSARYSPDGRRLVTGCADGQVRVWDIASGTAQVKGTHAARIRQAKFSHDGKLIASAADDSIVAIWDAASGRLISRLPHPSWVTDVAFSPNDAEVVTASVDGRARVWETNGVQRLPEIIHEDAVTSVGFSADGRWILTASMDGTARIWQDRTLLPVPVNHTLRNGGRIRRASFSADGSQVVLGGESGAVYVWSLTGQVSPPPAPRSVISGDGQRLMICVGGEVSITNMATGMPAGQPLHFDARIELIRLSVNGRLGAVVRQGTPTNCFIATLFDVQQPQTRKAELEIKTDHWAICLDADGQHAAVLDGDLIRIVDLSTGMVTSGHLPIADYDGSILNWHGQRLITWGPGSTFMRVWSLPSVTECYSPLKMPTLVSDLRLSPDGTRLLASCSDTTLAPCYAVEWDLATGQEIGTRMNHQDGVLSTCYSPDETKIGTGGEDYDASIWDASEKHQHLRGIRHHGQVNSVAFNLDATAFITGSRDGTTRIWSIATGDPLSPAFYHLAGIKKAMLLGDNSHLWVETTRDNDYLWTIIPDPKPVADVRLIADILSGETSEEQGGSTPERRAFLQTNWARLRQLYPAMFSASTAEVQTWHEHLAQECESRKDWYGAVYHLKILARNGDTNATARLNAANANALR
ncbi:MAG TPA: protein kinase [Verrucomicrobiae bacterium]